MSITPIAAEAESTSTPGRIVQLLQRARNSGLELHVAVPGSADVWRTTISRIDAKSSSILYHQLTPSTWQQANLASEAEVHCLVPGCRLAYSVVLTPIEDSGVSYFESSLPTTLRYHELRKLFRVSVTSHRSEISIGSGWLEGELVDISEGGCRARLDTPSDSLSSGQFLDDCRVWIEGTLDISCEIEVCHSRFVGEKQEVGLAFHSLAGRDAQQVQRCVAELQRANLRRGHARSA
jgi:c-di-GMP-binding flagellar brake protein YcgR